MHTAIAAEHWGMLPEPGLGPKPEQHGCACCRASSKGRPLLDAQQQAQRAKGAVSIQRLCTVFGSQFTLRTGGPGNCQPRGFELSPKWLRGCCCHVPHTVAGGHCPVPQLVRVWMSIFAAHSRASSGSKVQRAGVRVQGWLSMGHKCTWILIKHCVN